MVGAPTWSQVLSFDGGLLRRAAEAWGRLADRMEQDAAAIDPLVAATEAAWQGQAAHLAAHRLRRLGHTMDAAWLPLRARQRALSDLADGGQRLRGHAHDLMSRATAAGVWISPQGTVVPAGIARDFAAAAVASYQRQVGEVLTEAARLDREVAGRLAELTPPTPRWWHASVARSTIPELDSDPVDVHRWWVSLTEAEQAYALAQHPDLIGPLDGVPVDVRDRANHTLLERERRRLTEQVAELERQLQQTPPQPVFRIAARRLAAQRDDAADLLHVLDLIAGLRAGRSSDGTRAYLLRLDTSGDGRAVVAIGNPDHAAQVLTYVPGRGTTLRNSDGGLERAEQMADDTAALTSRAEPTSVVYWCDYDAPHSLVEAASLDAATDGAAALRRYSDGLRATHAGDGAYHTVLGHSYGSTVVGAGARAGLSADTLVFVGSPGAAATSVDELKIDGDPRSQVWASTAVSDPIHLARPFPGMTVASKTHLPLPGFVHALGDRMVHGVDPTSERFGALTFDADLLSGHTGYWDEGNAARDHIARIATGG